MASGEVKLLFVWPSPYSMRVEVALVLKGVSYAKVDENLSDKSPLLLKSNPVHKKIPVLLHDGKAVCESLIILQYVDEAFPSTDGQNLLPNDPYCRSVARFWADFVDKKIIDKIFKIWYKEEEEQTATAELNENLSTLEEALRTIPKEPPFFGGAKVNYVDVVMSPIISWHEVFEKQSGMKFEEKLPRLTAWMKAMRDAPCGQILPEPAKITEFVYKIYVPMLEERRKQAAQAAKAETRT